MENETKVPDVYRAIRDVTKALSMDGISKNKQNDQQHYSFRGIDDIFNALSAVIVVADLCILPQMKNRTVEERPTKSGGVLFYVTVEAEYRLISARDGSCDVSGPFFGEAMDSGDKATNKAMSAAYKYFALQTFCIPTEGMIEDADSTTHEPAAKAPEAAKPVPVQRPPQAAQKPTTIHSPQMTVAATINFTGETWLKKFIAAGRPEIFKQILGNAGYQQIDQIPDMATANKIWVLVRDEYQALFAKK